jgi:inactivated superfamily I helicase
VHEKRPTDAEIRFWVRRVRVEHDRGRSIEQTSAVLHQMIENWRAVEIISAGVTEPAAADIIAMDTTAKAPGAI